jgi:pyruvate carboxylase subunit B
METNEGIRLLTGNPKIDVPLKKKEGPAVPAPAAPAAAAPAIVGPVTTRCTVDENGTKRTFVVTLEPATATGSAPSAAPAAVVEAPAAASGTKVFSTFAGSVEIVDILVHVGDSVFKGGVVAEVEAMKAKHDIKAPCDGKVTAIHAKIGDEIDSSKPILTIS